MEIQTARLEDYKKIASLVKEAFTLSEHGYGNEVELVEKIRQDESYLPELEIVAKENNTLLDYGLLSKVEVLDTSGKSLTGLVLAPLAVSPSFQGQKIGEKILRELETRGKSLGYPFISILGHPTYYPKFGYVKASTYHIFPPFEVPDEAFMIKELFPNSLKNSSGTIHYAPLFSDI